MSIKNPHRPNFHAKLAHSNSILKSFKSVDISQPYHEEW